MSDYGHDLRLGAFLTPQGRGPQDVVALAQLSEQSGLDLVGFQDPPYQPALGHPGGRRQLRDRHRVRA